MTLLNAPAYNERRETLKRNLLVGSGILIVALVLITLTGYVMGHGWFFINLPAEYKVKSFLNTVEQGDYAKAYGIWEHDPEWQQHPEKYKDYPLQRFTEDWTTETSWEGPVTSFHVDVSKRNATGTAVAATINGKKRLFLFCNKSDGTITYFPNEIAY
jgi:hypothetical protein